MRKLAIIAALAVMATACGPDIVDTSDTTIPLLPPGEFGEDLVVFESCDDLLDYYIDHALELVGPYGLPGSQYGGWPRMGVEETADDAGADTPSTSTSTNVQVAGVDEADIVKSDGDRIITLVDDHLRTWAVGDAAVTQAGSLKLPFWGQVMFLHRNTVIVIGSGHGGSVPVDTVAGDIAPSYGSPVTTILEIDITDLADPDIVRSVEFDGSYAESRLVDGAMRVAVNSGPVGLEWAYPDGGGLRAEREATEANREIIRNSTLDNWLPYSVVTDGAIVRDGELLDCTRVMVPEEFSGLDTLSVLTFDLDIGVGTWDGAGLVASGATMYATSEHTYLATQRWVDWWAWDDVRIREEAEGITTHIHLFETIGHSAPRYVASGEVTGFLLNQFAMDEHDGRLRVASTTAPVGWWSSDDSESLVTVLEADGTELVEVGRVDGLGLTEQIYSVRFMGDVGYVVTFRQTDPLYVVDLSDPTAPRVAGELKIPGYSAYLHPVGEGRILGLGQDADETGRVTGTQLSLFDVSDPANPVRLDTVTMEGGWSQAESDHHAFTYVDGLILAPYERWEWIETGDGGRSMYDAGVLATTLQGDELNLGAVLRPEADGPIDEKDWNRIDPWRWSPLRTIVIDDAIYVVSRGGISIFDADTFDRLAWVAAS